MKYISRNKNNIILLVIQSLYHSEPVNEIFGTYRVCKQRRLRQACESTQSHQSLRCSHTQRWGIDEGSAQNIYLYSPTRSLRMYFLNNDYTYIICDSTEFSWTDSGSYVLTFHTLNITTLQIDETKTWCKHWTNLISRSHIFTWLKTNKEKLASWATQLYTT